jgi:hypothetical protein
MSAVAEAATLLRQVAEPRPVGDTVKAAINRAARRVSIRPGRVEDIWREEAKAIRAEEMDAIRRAAAQERVAREAKHELAELDARIARLEALLVHDEDHYRPQVDALRSVARRPHRPVDGDAK